MKSKSLLLTAVATLCFAIVGFAQNVPSYVPTNGLVGWWPFNGNANDESGNGNNGTVNGATLASDRFGNVGKAYSFNGTSNYITVPNSNSLNPSEISINLWLKCDLIKTYNNIFSKKNHANANNFGYSLGFSSDSVGAGWAKGSCLASDVGGAYNNVASFIPLNSWIMYTILISPAGICKHYYNGNLIKETITNQPFNPCNAADADLRFGEWWSGDPQWLKGNLDDIAIYNRALTQQEITNLYNASLTPITCPTMPANLQTGLVGYWPFCGNANDESGNGNNGTVNGATLTTDRFGNAGKSYSFNGTSNYISVPNSSSLSSGLNSITMSAWININEWYNVNNNGWFPIISKSDLTNTYGLYRLGIVNKPATNLVAVYGNLNTEAGGTEQNNLIQTGQWRHIALSIDLTNHTSKTFINGNLIKDTLNAYSGWAPNPSLPLIIGMDRPGIVDYANGKIDDICIWNRALDSTEVTQLYQTQSTASSNGNVGVNVVVPQRSLHVKDVMRMEPRSAAPENPVKGDIYFDGVLNKLRVYDGTAWQNCW